MLLMIACWSRNHPSAVIRAAPSVKETARGTTLSVAGHRCLSKMRLPELLVRKHERVPSRLPPEIPSAQASHGLDFQSGVGMEQMEGGEEK